MGILDGVIGGLVSAGATAVISKVIEQHGGVQGIVQQFEKSGLGSIAQSWVGTGANQAISADQIKQALGSNAVQELAAKAGIPADEIAKKLADLLPAAIDKLTPAGQVAA